MRPSSGWSPVRVLPVPLNSYSQMEGWELRKRFPPQQQCAGSWPALHEPRAMLFAGMACGCWSRSETAQVTPQAQLPALTLTQMVSAANVEYSQEEDSSQVGKEFSCTNVLYHLAAGLKCTPLPILVFIQAWKRSWRTCRMSVAKWEPEARVKAPERYFLQPSVQRSAQHGGVVTCPWLSVKQ